MRRLLLSAIAVALLAAPAAANPAFPNVTDTSYAEPDGSQVIRQSIRVKAPAERVWTAISTAEGWRGWAVPAAWVDFRIGGVIETSYDPAATRGRAGNIRNEIVTYVPGRLLAIRTIQAPPGFEHAEEFGRTTTLLELKSLDADTTEVTLTGVGFRPEPAFKALFEKFRQGDAWTLESLKKSLEGTPPDWARAEAGSRLGKPK